MTQTRPDTALHPGDVINNTYRIEALLGRGGTSDVYKACNEISGRPMALKVLKAEFSDNDDYLVLLKREEEIREVRHDAVVRYSENHRMDDGRVYLLMDFVDGPGMDTCIRTGPIPAADLLTICRRVAEGLEAAHARHIVHRDLSPDNIILRDGDPAQAVIIDFGIAKDTNPGAETIVGNEFAGKYAYAAPEQLRGQTDERSDLFALGALLLAGFRGAPPDLGQNPAEVIENKSKPLDTDDVPEPLKTLIERLSAPDPDDRFQSAGEVLRFLDAPHGAGRDASVADPELTDKTVIPAAAPASTVSVPPASPPSDPPANGSPQGGKDGDGQTGGLVSARRSRGLIAAGLAGLVVLAAGLGAYTTGTLDSLLAAPYPVADPFTLLVESSADGGGQATGFVPDEDLRTDLTDRIAAGGGSVDLTLASGDISDTWGSDIQKVLAALTPLDHWRLSARQNDVTVTGETDDAAIEASVEASFANGLPGALNGTVDITLLDPPLTRQEVADLLASLADCGPLTPSDAPPEGYGQGMPITISGQVAETATRVRLFDRLKTLAGSRQVILDIEVLNPTLCLLERDLPTAPPGGVDIVYYLGDRMEPNDTDSFLVGENPVIDVVLPPDMTDGYLMVSILDVSGNVFHLLPNVLRPDNSIADLRGGAPGPVPVRVAFRDIPGRPKDQLAFRVDASTLGKSKVVVIQSSEPLFDGLRPMEESAAGFAEALKAHAGENASLIRTLDSRLLITQTP
ncbi:MAG: protein kinase domain-containing protein [Marinibacterium sp.]